MIKIIIIAWAVFDALIFLLLWFDTIYYRFNLPKVCRKVLDAITEDEE